MRPVFLLSAEGSALILISFDLMTEDRLSSAMVSLLLIQRMEKLKKGIKIETKMSIKEILYSDMCFLLF